MHTKISTQPKYYYIMSTTYIGELIVSVEKQLIKIIELLYHIEMNYGIDKKDVIKTLEHNMGYKYYHLFTMGSSYKDGLYTIRRVLYNMKWKQLNNMHTTLNRDIRSMEIYPDYMIWKQFSTTFRDIRRSYIKHVYRTHDRKNTIITYFEDNGNPNQGMTLQRIQQFDRKDVARDIISFFYSISNVDVYDISTYVELKSYIHSQIDIEWNIFMKIIEDSVFAMQRKLKQIHTT